MVNQTEDTKNKTIAESRAKVQQHIEEQSKPKIVKAWISNHEVKKDGQKILFEVQSAQGDIKNMIIETTDSTDLSTEAQILESYTGKPITKPDMYESTKLYHLNLQNGGTAFCLPKSKKLAQVIYENSPNQKVTKSLISSQQSFTSLFLLTIPSMVCMLLSLPIGGPKLFLATVAFVFIAFFIQIKSSINDLKRQIQSKESN